MNDWSIKLKRKWWYHWKSIFTRITPCLNWLYYSHAPVLLYSSDKWRKFGCFNNLSISLSLLLSLSLGSYFQYYVSFFTQIYNNLWRIILILFCHVRTEDHGGTSLLKIWFVKIKWGAHSWLGNRICVDLDTQCVNYGRDPIRKSGYCFVFENPLIPSYLMRLITGEYHVLKLTKSVGFF